MGYILGVSNQSTQPYFQRLMEVYEQESVLIASEKELAALFEKQNLEEADLCFVQASLVWNKRSSLQFYGFDIAKKLRKRGLRCVVQIVTPFNASWFELSFPRHALLKVPEYHQLMKLTLSREQLQALPFKRMSRELLHDIKDSLLNIPSILREVIHGLKNQLSFNKKDLEEVVKIELQEKTDKSFKELSTLLPDKKEQLIEIRNEFVEKCLDLTGVNLQEGIQKILETITDQLLALTPAPEQVENIGSPQKNKWRVLFVDDDENIRTIVKEGLERNNIFCQLAKNAEEVFQFLGEDRKWNRISILICDLRLINEQTKEWQPLQGYDIIKEVQRKHPNQLAYFVLTSGKARLLRITESYKVNVYAHYKRDVINSEGALNLFSDKVREIGEQIFFSSRSQPDLSAWRKPTSRFYKPHSFFYKNHISDIYYEQEEEAINKEARDFVHNVLTGQGNEKKELIITINPSKDNEDERLLLKKFRDHILLGRRIALGLYVNGFSEEEIFDHMHDQTKVSNREASKKMLFNTTLALSFKNDFPLAEDLRKGHYLKSRLLIEEIEWLIATYQTDFNFNDVQLNQKDWNSLSQILENLQDHIRAVEETSDVARPSVYDSFFSLNLNKLTLKTAPRYFKMAQRMAEAYHLTKSLKEDVQLDLEELNNEEVRKLLVNLF